MAIWLLLISLLNTQIEDDPFITVYVSCSGDISAECTKVLIEQVNELEDVEVVTDPRYVKNRLMSYEIWFSVIENEVRIEGEAENRSAGLVASWIIFERIDGILNTIADDLKEIPNQRAREDADVLSSYASRETPLYLIDTGVLACDDLNELNDLMKSIVIDFDAKELSSYRD